MVSNISADGLALLGAKPSTETVCGVGVTKGLFVNFSVSTFFDLAKVPLRLFEWHSYLTGATIAELQ